VHKPTLQRSWIALAAFAAVVPQAALADEPIAKDRVAAADASDGKLGRPVVDDLPPVVDRPAPAPVVAPVPQTPPASPSPRPSMLAVRAAHAPTLDGVLDDAAWRAAPVTDAFTQKFPDDGRKPSERTELRVVYDADALYIAFDCTQVHSQVVARLARRDRDVGADKVEIDIGDGARTFQFSVNAAGVLGDGIRFNDVDYSADWDGVWDARVSQRADGWSAELRIPLLTFRLEPDGAQDWRIQARRFVSVRQETDEWAYTPRTVAGEVSHYGDLTGMTGLSRGNPFELRPFVVARATRATGTATGYGGTAGLDGRWRISPSIDLDVTVNPDFAQVEADQQALNLTTFEMFFPEKRPFFLDGMDMFQMPRMQYFASDQTLFYSRRIGAVPEAPAAPGAPTESDPSPATIYGAAKLRGTFGAGISGSVLSAFTGPSDVQLEPTDAPMHNTPAAPPSWFNVARVRAQLSDQAQVGVLATATQRFESTGDYPKLTAPSGMAGQLCPGGETTVAGGRCFHDSYVAATDGYWRSSSGDYVVAGQALMTAIAGGPTRRMLDGTLIGAGDTGAGGSFYAAKEGGDWLASVEGEAEGRKADFNDLGFMVRQNHLRLLPTAEYRATAPFDSIAQIRTRVSASFRDTVDGLDLWRGYYAATDVQFTNAWDASTMVFYWGRQYDDREIGDGTAIEREPGVGWDVNVSSDPGRRVSGSLSSELLTRSTGHDFSLTGQLGIHVMPRLELQILPQATLSTGETRYVVPADAVTTNEARYIEGPQPDTYLFGKLDARSVGATLRANYTLTTRLTLQLYTQALLIAKHYSSFTSLPVAYTGGGQRLIHLADLRPAATPSDNPDDQEATLDINAVLRWEFSPGSTVFLVYTRSQTPESVLMASDHAALDVGALRKGPAADALLLKVSYWWN
jgi:hypothetical protein